MEEGKVFVIRPEEQMIRHFENNNEKLLQCYQYGYDTMRKQFKAFVICIVLLLGPLGLPLTIKTFIINPPCFPQENPSLSSEERICPP